MSTTEGEASHSTAERASQAAERAGQEAERAGQATDPERSSSRDVGSESSTPAVTPAVSTYVERTAKFTQKADALGARSRLVSNLRGVSFALFVGFAIYWMVGDDAQVAMWLTLVSLSGFVVLVVVHSRVLQQEDMALRWVQVNREAAQRCGPNFRDLPETGEEFQNPVHPYADDLDTFGRGSLFQRIAVVRTHFGKRRLAAFLMNRSRVDEVTQRQAAVQELSEMLELRQELEALALSVVEPTSPREAEVKRRRRPAPVDAEPLLAWAEGGPALSTNKPLVLVARAAPPLTLAWLAYCLAQDWHPLFWITPLIAQAILLLAARGVTAQVFATVSSTQGAFLRFGPMLALLENLQPESQLLRELKQATESENNEPPSHAMRSFERAVSWFELRHNGLVYPFINGLLLWDIHCVLMLEAWQARSGGHLRRWFQALGEFEALSALAAFAHDNPDFTFPKMTTGAARFEARALGHPLLGAGQRVCNDVSLPAPGRALLVTGSNMSGKSTLLRAMGVNAVLAQAGAPVCAQELTLTPLAVRTSMRISDSLGDGVSHFYAEIRKLSGVLKAVEGDAPVFFLLDEILHGTNSRERQIGARWVLAELLSRGALGAVSTHDSGLCELPPALMQSVRQVHLRETVRDDEMTFDYLVREGPVRSGNALRLMQSLGIDVPLDE